MPTSVKGVILERKRHIRSPDSHIHAIMALFLLSRILLLLYQTVQELASPLQLFLSSLHLNFQPDDNDVFIYILPVKAFREREREIGVLIDYLIGIWYSVQERESWKKVFCVYVRKRHVKEIGCCNVQTRTSITMTQFGYILIFVLCRKASASKIKLFMVSCA